MTKEEVLIAAASAATTKGTSGVPLNGYRACRVYAEFGAGTTAGVVTVRHRRAPGLPPEDLGTLAWAAASQAKSLRVDGPVGLLEVEITTAIAGGTVTVAYLANAA